MQTGVAPSQGGICTMAAALRTWRIDSDVKEPLTTALWQKNCV
jgi:hypothetical protein